MPEVAKDFEFSNVVLKVELLSCRAPVPSAGMDQFLGQMSPRDLLSLVVVALVLDVGLEHWVGLALAAYQL